MNLGEYLSDIETNHPNVKCVCLCTRLTCPDGKYFRAYLRIFINDYSVAWFSIDMTGMSTIHTLFPYSFMGWSRFQQTMISLLDKGYKWHWIPTNHISQRFKLLWDSDIPSSDMMAEYRDINMLYYRK